MLTVKALGSLAVLWTLLLLGAATPSNQELLWQYRNLGKAFYENPDTHAQAAEELGKALQLNPGSVRERINYGLALLRTGQNEKGAEELIAAQKQDASLPYTWFNLGILYKHNADYEKAIEQFQAMIKLVPNEPVAHYNLAAILRSKGELQAALPEFLQAVKLNGNLAGPHFQLFSLYQRLGDKESATRERKLFEEAKKRDGGAAVPEDMEWCYYAELYDPPDPRPSPTEPTKYDDHLVASGWNAKQTRMLALDSTGAGKTDLLVWSQDRVVLYRNGVEETKSLGLDGLSGILDIAVGDFDNDGLADLAVITVTEATLFHNEKGTFAKRTGIPSAFGPGSKAIFFDPDHDNDLDLLVFGPKPAFLRNEVGGKWENKTADFPFVPGQVSDVVRFAARGDTAARDLIVGYADHEAILYRDQLNCIFTADRLPVPAGLSELSAQDVNHDGLMDLVSYAPSKKLWINAAGDLNVPAVLKEQTPKDLEPAALTADFNGDGRQDYVRLLPDGSLHLWTNASSAEHWLRVSIQGVKNTKLAPGATVETKSGPYYQKAVFLGVPLSFPVDGHADADTVRITWPNGLIQNETHQKTGEPLKIAEAQRLSGSCPMIFAWNGQRFEFVTDILGVAPLGASSGDGHYFPVNHRETIQIPGSVLRSDRGRYRVHITEELHEVSYLDQVRLTVVDHPEGIHIYTNDKFKSPPYPEFRLWGGRSQVHPIRAVDSGRWDVTQKVARTDGQYPDGFSHNQSGVADRHTLDLDFGKALPREKAVLVLNGWVDWADGSTFLGATQGGGGLEFPSIQVKDRQGRWVTAIADMGIPSGKPKAIAVDLTGKFVSQSREVRIVTNLCVYWDEIFLLDTNAAPAVRLTEATNITADLHFRGFSEAVIDPARQQPERFLYDHVRPVSNWNPIAGNYTRYGDVKSLTAAVDDRLTIMGSGDELSLEFAADGLPKLPPGWTRDFLLTVDGWAKDSDANTAYSQSVMPLPFHGMSAYPYPAAESFPSDLVHRQFLTEYQTRPALRLLRPLTEMHSRGY